MLEELMNLVRQSGQQSVVDNPAVPNEQNEAVMQEASSSIFGGLQNMLQTGGPAALQNLFQGVQSGDPNHPAVQQVANQFSGNLMQKFGLDSGVAKSIAISLIPVVLSKLMNHAQASNNNGFSIGNILGSLMGSGNNNNNNTAAPNSSGGGLLGSIASTLGLSPGSQQHSALGGLMSMFGH